MAEGIRKSFKTAIINKLYENAVLNDSNFDKDKYIKYLKDNIDYKDVYYSSDRYTITSFRKTYDTIINVVTRFNDDNNSNIFLDIALFKKIYKLACEDVEEETKQAMEAFIHNLNTLHSRSGAQCPFSSLNYGLDTSNEGRLATEKLLQATWNGLGKGETPIFPIQIFTLKEGINYNPGDPNYDLFKLACKVSAKRLFPGFTNQDASYNLPYYKEDDYRTHITAMGCAEGKELVTYVYKGKYYCETLENMYERVEETEKEYGITKYKSPSDMVVFDGNEDSVSDGNISKPKSGNWVKVLNVIKNPDCGDWNKLYLSNGRELLLTSNHPIYTENRGRVQVADLEYGDKIKIYKTNPVEGSSNVFNEDLAYLLGILMYIGKFTKTITIKLDIKNNTGCKQKIMNLLRDEWRLDSRVSEFNYTVKKPYEIIKVSSKTDKHEYLKDILGTDLISKRHFPVDIFTSSRNVKLSFIAGIVDANYYMKYTNKAYIGCISKSTSLQLVALLQSIGINAILHSNYISEKHPNGIKYCIEFTLPRDIKPYLANSDKENIDFIDDTCNRDDDIVTVSRVSFIGSCNKESYDIETTSDKFSLSFINSGNCRTRVIGNVNGPEICTSRGNFAFVTMNLAKMGIEADKNIDKFFEILDKYITLGHDYLKFRFNIIKKKHIYNYPFLMEQGVWLDSEKHKPNDTIEDVLKHCSLSIGFCGLAECLVSLIGKHHGESDEAQELGLKIIGRIRERTDKYTKDEHMNWTCFASPAESTAGSLQKYNRKKYGIIKGVTDKPYLTNGSHVPVYYKISSIDKIKKEAPYHKLCNAGNIGYIEFDGDPLDNLEAFESIIRAMHDNDMGYFNINHPVDRDPICGYTGIIKNECPHCKRKEKYCGCIDIPRIE